MKSLQLKKRNLIQLAVSLICLVLMIPLIRNTVFQSTASGGDKWFWDCPPWQYALYIVIAVVLISFFAVSALRSVTNTYRILCVTLPLVAMFVPTLINWYVYITHMDPTPVASVEESMRIGHLVMERHYFILTTSIITGVALSLLVLLWELKRSGIIGAKRVRAVGGVLAK